MKKLIYLFFLILSAEASAYQMVYTNHFNVVYHFIHEWASDKSSAWQITTTEWYTYLNDNNLAGGGGSWGNTAHGWQSDVTYPANVKIDGSSTGTNKGYNSLQGSNLNHTPWTEPTWWEEVATPGIGSDEALWTNTAGTTKMSGYSSTANLTGHLYAVATQNNEVFTHVFDTQLTQGQFIAFSAGLGEPALRMSLTEDTCYTVSMIPDGEGGTNIYFYRITNGDKVLIHSYYYPSEFANLYQTRFYIRQRGTLGLDYSSMWRVDSANKTTDPIGWSTSWTTITEHLDTSPIPQSGHEYVGIRMKAATPGDYQITHEGFGGSFSLMTRLNDKNGSIAPLYKNTGSSIQQLYNKNGDIL